MSVLSATASTAESINPLIGSAPPSPAGPVDSLAGLRTPPLMRWPRPVQVMWFGQRQWHYMFHHRKKYGECGWRAATCVAAPPRPITPTTSGRCSRRRRTSFRRSPPNRRCGPVLGDGSVLTSNGPRHLRQRKLLLPPFHGEAIARYEQMIADAAEREIDALAGRQAVRARPADAGDHARRDHGGHLRDRGRGRGRAPPSTRCGTRSNRLLWSSTQPGAKLAEWMNLGHDEPFGLTWLGLFVPDRCMYAVIAKRRRDQDLEQRTDIMSLIMRARTEDGDTLTDDELRDELMTLVLAGHETTANQLAWAWERLVRTPAAHELLIESVRGDAPNADEVIEATINEAMRVRPVIPVTGRRVTVPWRLGEYGIPADTGVAVSILLLHHREDLYPDPFSFRPERWFGHKPGTYEWLPFGGGTRRCLGAALAMAEQRVVLRAMAKRLDLEVADEKPERPKHRNVTMIPARGGRVVIRGKR